MLSANRIRVVLLAMVLMAVPRVYAQKDFLTPNEVDQVRMVQEPVARIKLYLQFARQRLDQLQSIMAKNRPGRSGEMRQLLEDYTSIVDAINTVTDDALARKQDLTAGPAAVVEGEKKFLDVLGKIQASMPRDIDMYDFELKEAIASTGDSIELANQDLSDRGQAVASKAEQEKKKVAEVNAGEAKLGGSAAPGVAASEAAAADAAQPARKPPTLYRPGEKPPDK